MKAEKKMGIPIFLRTGFAISTETGKAANTMTEDEWDAVVNVHLKGHFVPTRWAANYWREQAKAGEPVNASIIHTSSLVSRLSSMK